MKNKIKLFDQQQIRTIWDEKNEEWYFSVVDVIAVLVDSVSPQVYWRVLKKRLKAEGNETVTNCNGLKLLAADGKMRLTDVATTKQLLRLIQSIPSKKAEPFKIWLAQVGSERLDEAVDPELTINRALAQYRALGYPDDWINQRLKAIEIRKALTDEWDKRGVKKGVQYAQLTDLMTTAWAGMNTRAYKKHKGLTKQNLRDNMTNMELILNMLAEATTTEVSQVQKPTTFAQNAAVAKAGGAAAGEARAAVEKRTGKSVISAQNAQTLIKNRSTLATKL